MRTHLQWAKQRIREIRTAVKNKDSRFDFENTANLLRWNLREADLTLKDVGTSESQLRRLCREHYRNLAAYWLQQRFLGYRTIGTSIRYIRRYLRKAHAKPEDIGTTKEDLDIIDFNYWSQAAREVLAELRLTPWRRKNPRKYAIQLRDHFILCKNAAGISLNEFGTSMQELRKYCR